MIVVRAGLRSPRDPGKIVKLAVNIVSFVAAICSPLIATTPVVADLIRDGNDFLINTIELSTQISPSVESFDSGGFVVVWSGPERDGYATKGILGQRLATDGSFVGSEFLVSTPTRDPQPYESGGGQSFPAIGGGADGSFVVTWERAYDQDGDLHGVFGQRLDATGKKLGTEFLVNTYTTGSQHGASIGVRTDGSFVVSWMDTGYFGATGNELYVRQYDENGVPLDEGVLITGDKAAQPVYPIVAAGETGITTVVWMASDDSRKSSDVFLRKIPVDGSLNTDAVRVNEGTAGNQWFPHMTTLESGGFLVVWEGHEETDSDADIYARMFSANGVPVTGDIRVNERIDGTQQRPRVASIDDQAIVVWVSDGQDGDGYGVFARLLDSEGRADGPEFQVNSYTTGNQGGGKGSEIDVAVDGNGSVLVTWESARGRDADREGIVGQLLCFFDRDAAKCGDAACPTGQLSSRDAQVILKAAIGLGACEVCLCDTDDSGIVTARDALAILRASVGLAAAPTGCPTCD